MDLQKPINLCNTKVAKYVLSVIKLIDYILNKDTEHLLICIYVLYIFKMMLRASVVLVAGGF